MGRLLQSLQLAEVHCVPFAPHNVGGPVATIAYSHVAANAPNFLVLEFHVDDIPWYYDLVTGAVPVVKNGYLPVLDAPGYGVEINEEVAAAHPDP